MVVRMPPQSFDGLHSQFNRIVTYLRSDKAKKFQRLACEIGFEIFLVVVFLKAYNLVRNQFGSIKCTPQFALGHALQVIRAERALGMFWEQEIQGMVINFNLWIRFWNIFYGTAHMAVTVFVLVYLFALKPGAYQRCRTVFIIMNILAISGYAGYPLMPPRLVNACDDPYGGCSKGYTFVDTLHEIGGVWSWKDKAVSKVSNHYAAMPSMHAGYSLWCSVSMYGYSPHAFFRALALVYPVMTLYCIVVTANHFFLDAVFGALAFWIATKIATIMPRVGRGAHDSDDYTANDVIQQADEKHALLPISMSQGAEQFKVNGQTKAGNGLHEADSDEDAAALIKPINITVRTLQKR